MSRTVTALDDTASRTSQWSARHRWPLVLSFVAWVGAPLLAFALQRWQELDGFDHTLAHATNEQVAALLNGEQLVAPPTLPPELFSTPEVERARPLVFQASRQWELLDDAFRQRLLLVFKIMREQHGYDMVLLEGYRSPERQSQLAALGPRVTSADAFQSYHQFGLAADCAFISSGRIVITETDPWAARGYQLYGEVARSVGLTWGGGWRRIKDLGHVELSRPGVLAGSEAPTPTNAHAL